MKRFIYPAKCKEEVLNFQVFISKVFSTMKIEEQITWRNDKIEIFTKKWKIMLQHV